MKCSTIPAHRLRELKKIHAGKWARRQRKKEVKQKGAFKKLSSGKKLEFRILDERRQLQGSFCK